MIQFPNAHPLILALSSNPDLAQVSASGIRASQAGLTAAIGANPFRLELEGARPVEATGWH